MVSTATEGSGLNEIPEVSNRKAHVRRACRVQDGHSSGEQCLYAVLWENSSAEDRDSRVITIGWDRMGRLANLNANNARIACHRLIKKLAVDVVSPRDSNTRTGTTYRIWSWAGVVRRRKAAGMEFYIKSRGVEFVRPPAEYPDARARWDQHQRTMLEKSTALETGTVLEMRTVTETIASSVPVSSENTPPVSAGASLKQSNRIESIETSSSLVAEVARCLEVDHDVALEIVDKTLAVAPDFTARHLVHLAELKVRQTPRIRNLPGFLMTALPRAARGALGDRVRREVGQEMERDYRRARAILDDPTSPEDMRSAARAFLGLAG